MRREGMAEPLLRDLYEFRLLIEPQAAAWMAEHGERRRPRAASTRSRRRWTGSPEATPRSPTLMGADRELPRPGRPREREPDRRRGQQGHPRGARHAVGASRRSGPTRREVVAEQHRAIADAIGRRDADGGGRGDARAPALGRAGRSARVGRRAGSTGGPGSTGGQGVAVGLVVGIDTGGTFTDLVVLDTATGQDRVAQDVVDCRARPGTAIVNALAEGDVPAAELEAFTHGTTVGTNALIERTGCRVAFLTTAGLRGHAVHPADQPQGALRPALAQAGAARREPAPLPRASTSG